MMDYEWYVEGEGYDMITEERIQRTTNREWLEYAKKYCFGMADQYRKNRQNAVSVTAYDNQTKLYFMWAKLWRKACERLESLDENVD